MRVLIFLNAFFFAFSSFAGSLESYISNDVVISPVIVKNMPVSSVRPYVDQRRSAFEARDLAGGVCFYAGFSNLVSYSVKEMSFPDHTEIAVIFPNSLQQYSVPIMAVKTYKSQVFKIKKESGAIPIFDNVVCNKPIK